ncbi:low-density lipoprotein receptor 1-like [Clytia hemisphaerica]|uniref:low-density lipoprotein receptor 1-like n=1 Tax=Clytia hemisphaerica TaxID=252671 RepID=UPI0034D5511D
MALLILFLTFILTLTAGSSKTCNDDEFKCIKTGHCILNKFKCDGYFDCIDKSDEKDCPEDSCNLQSEVFRCKSTNTCIPLDFQCDGLTDCKDQSDEEGCEKTSCNSGLFTCKTSGKCIHKSWVCDNQNDCPDNSDEINCTNYIGKPKVPLKCHENQFQCKSSAILQCINKKWVCDGHNDCYDNSDEPENCKKIECDDKTEFQCLDGTCILKDFVCNDYDDCNDTVVSVNLGTVSALTSSSDEQNCHKKVQCEKDQFQCLQTKECIPINKVCDFKADCTDKSDEARFCKEEFCKEKCSKDASCRRLPTGGICVCNNTGLRHINGSCQDINECEEDKTLCQHQCVNTFGSYKCQCVSSDYALEDDQRTCRYKNADEDDLIFVHVGSIQRYNIRSKLKYNIISNLKKGVALDYDIEDGRLFYSDVTKNVIYSSHIKKFEKNVTQVRQ